MFLSPTDVSAQHVVFQNGVLYEDNYNMLSKELLDQT